MTPLVGWAIFCYATVITVIYFLNEFLYIKEKEARIKDNQRRDEIIDFRSDLLDTMAENDDRNREVANTIRDNKVKEEYLIKSKTSLELFRKITFKEIYNSDKPVEDFYPQDVMDKLIWKFDQPEYLPINQDVVH